MHSRRCDFDCGTLAPSQVFTEDRTALGLIHVAASNLKSLSKPADQVATSVPWATLNADAAFCQHT